MPDQLPAIKHIVQLMLENRSFDEVLGFPYTAENNKTQTGQAFEGLTCDESNPDETGREIEVFKIERTAEHPYLMRGADPGEGFKTPTINYFDLRSPHGQIPNNKGFVNEL